MRVQTVRYNLLSFECFFLVWACWFYQYLPYGWVQNLPLLALVPVFVGTPRQYNTIYWKLDLNSSFFVFSWLIVWADKINKCGWCLPEGKDLTGKLEPDPKCKLIISSFVTLPHLLDSLICTRNAMSIVFLQQIMGGGSGIGWGCAWFILEWGFGDRG